MKRYDLLHFLSWLWASSLAREAMGDPDFRHTSKEIEEKVDEYLRAFPKKDRTATL